MNKVIEPVTSPCVRICCLDDNDVCIGCGRTLDEIRRWSAMAEAEKRETLRQSVERRAAREAHISRILSR